MVLIWGLFVGSVLLVASLEATVPFSSAYLLVSHGSRDPRPQIALEHLAQLVTQRLYSLKRQKQLVALNAEELRLEAPDRWGIDPHIYSEARPLVGTAVLELAVCPLHEQLCQFAERAIALGYESIKILPLFLLPGVHVMEDIPAELAIAQQQLGSRIRCQLCPYLGSHADLGRLLLNPVDAAITSAQAGKIVIAHGSRRPDSHQPVAAIAHQLNALPAYWSVSPSLEAQVTALVKSGHSQIMVLPYFLFEGGITDAIAQKLDQLSQQFPYTQLQLGRPIGPTPALADCAVERLTAVY
jgi:sirohydrochlorin cobaltochelatase